MNELSPINPLLARAFWALIIIAAGLVFYWLLNRAILYRAQNNNAAHSLLSVPGTPAILYFTTPDCAACKTIQRPALYRIQERLGDRLQVVEINAQEQPELAARWGVLSVPTTFVIDQHGQLRHVNHGVTRADRLLQQLETVTGGAISSRA
jgi:thiol-disulfide isomerase/thioredoxin